MFAKLGIGMSSTDRHHLDSGLADLAKVRHDLEKLDERRAARLLAAGAPVAATGIGPPLIPARGKPMQSAIGTIVHAGPAVRPPPASPAAAADPRLPVGSDRLRPRPVERAAALTSSWLSAGAILGLAGLFAASTAGMFTSPSSLPFGDARTKPFAERLTTRALVASPVQTVLPPTLEASSGAGVGTPDARADGVITGRSGVDRFLGLSAVAAPIRGANAAGNAPPPAGPVQTVRPTPRPTLASRPTPAARPGEKAGHRAAERKPAQRTVR
jgi:hypothetical protein